MSDQKRSKEDLEYALGQLMVRFGSTAYRIEILKADLVILKSQLDDLNGEILLLGDRK